jgi:hypothetical protein
MLPDYTKSVRFNMCPISLIDNKRFIIEMYEKATGKKLLP